MSPEDIARFRRMIVSRSAALAKADGTGQGNRAPVEPDQQAIGRLSRTEALQHQAMAQADSRRPGDWRRRLDAALDRLERGGFGECADCGERIPVRRLERDPAAPLCISCASGQSMVRWVGPGLAGCETASAARSGPRRSAFDLSPIPRHPVRVAGASGPARVGRLAVICVQRRVKDDDPAPAVVRVPESGFHRARHARGRGHQAARPPDRMRSAGRDAMAVCQFGLPQQPPDPQRPKGRRQAQQDPRRHGDVAVVQRPHVVMPPEGRKRGSASRP